MHRIEIVALVEHGVEVDLLDLAHGPDVPGADRVHLLRLLALPFEQVPDAHGLLLVPDDDLALGLDGALVHAEHAEFPHERVGRHLEHMREHGGIRFLVGRERFFLVARSGALEKRAWVPLERAGQERGDDVEQVVDPRAGLGGAVADRDEVRLAQRLLEHIVELRR